jgi:hypothetical protein
MFLEKVSAPIPKTLKFAPSQLGLKNKYTCSSEIDEFRFSSDVQPAAI